MTAALVILARAPEPSRVKTRLAAAVGEAAALLVDRRLLAATARTAACWPGPVLVRYAGGSEAVAASELGAFPRAAQAAGGLGARVRAALDEAVAAHGRAIAISTDCPELAPEHLATLDRLLEGHEAVFGPAADGGYWGIGVRSPRVAALCGDDALPWSTPDLLAATLARLRSQSVSYALGPRLRDLDDVDDLRHARGRGLLRAPLAVGLSVIVPILDEALALPAALDRLAELAASTVEVVVTDGGSSDGSEAIARDHPAADAVVVAPGGRHRQLNAALAIARGRHVLCLPVDARLPAAALPRLLALLDERRPAAGCLVRHASNRTWPHRWLDGWARIRAQVTHGAYMDQGPIFARAAALAHGGFRAFGPYDTADLGGRIARSQAFHVLPVPMVVSCRAYAQRGLIATTSAHQWIRLHHHLDRR